MSAKARYLNLGAFALGVTFLVIMIQQLGYAQVASYLANVGWGFFWLVLIHVFTTFGDVYSLKVAVNHKEFTPVRATLIALSGTAINSLTPFGEAGEALKVNMMGAYVPVRQSVSAVVVWNFLYRITKWIIVFSAPFLILVFEPGLGSFTPWMVAGIFVASLICFLPTLLYALVIWKGAARIIINFLSKLPILKKKNWEKIMTAAEDADQQMAAFTRARRNDAFIIMGLLLFARLMAILEIWAVMRMIGHPVSYLVAMFLFSGGTVLRTLISISPVQIGVVEAGGGALFHLLGLPVDVGFTQMFIRRLRMMLFNMIGLVFLAFKSFGKQPIAKPAPTAEAPVITIKPISPADDDAPPKVSVG